MRLLDTYALYCGAKIDKPYIYESYFPLPFSKYLTFQAETPYDSRNYSYWQDVIDMIFPFITKEGYQIIQLGLSKERPYQRVVNLLGQSNLNQLAYLVKGSSLHFGPDSFGVHLSSHYDIPIVSLYSISMPEVAGPHFGTKSKHVLFKGYERVGNGKPSYSPQESPKSINTIRPEEIANAIFRQLGIDQKIPFETQYMGPRYTNLMVRELIPNNPAYMPLPDQPIDIRFDLHADEGMLVHHLNYWQNIVLTTNQPIKIDLIRAFKPRIKLITYWVRENDDPTFSKAVVELGVPLAIVSDLPPEAIQKKKISYYEFGVINEVAKPNADAIKSLKDKGLEQMYFRSSKLIASNGKIYGSHADVESDSPLSTGIEYHRVIDSPKFWQDLDFYTVVKKLF